MKRGEINPDIATSLHDPKLTIVMNGRGIIGALAAIPFYTNYEEALELCSGET